MTTDLCFRNATELAAVSRTTCGSPIHRYNLPVQSKEIIERLHTADSRFFTPINKELHNGICSDGPGLVL